MLSAPAAVPSRGVVAHRFCTPHTGTGYVRRTQDVWQTSGRDTELNAAARARPGPGGGARQSTPHVASTSADPAGLRGVVAHRFRTPHIGAGYVRRTEDVWQASGRGTELTPRRGHARAPHVPRRWCAEALRTLRARRLIQRGRLARHAEHTSCRTVARGDGTQVSHASHRHWLCEAYTGCVAGERTWRGRVRAMYRAECPPKHPAVAITPTETLVEPLWRAAADQAGGSTARSGSTNRSGCWANPV
ncbi:hypothetical protein SAMN04244553_2226 [Nocardia amikacinitolerans]|uniref:Uncharacterized protein n=1 Tax=Nocardia amikacinitolerans TaxID=756689 RepID=A0A285L6Z4_9NOCA|nr:hypothetical protein SAMN04244553_2226 [Nocardia amikacinitolerans]